MPHPVGSQGWSMGKSRAPRAKIPRPRRGASGSSRCFDRDAEHTLGLNPRPCRTCWPRSRARKGDVR
eukprot:741878-Alexandrium_andersonii.AAC.1